MAENITMSLEQRLEALQVRSRITDVMPSRLASLLQKVSDLNDPGAAYNNVEFAELLKQFPNYTSAGYFKDKLLCGRYQEKIRKIVEIYGGILPEAMIKASENVDLYDCIDIYTELDRLKLLLVRMVRYIICYNIKHCYDSKSSEDYTDSKSRAIPD